MRIATRQCYDVHRQRQRRPSVSLDRPGRLNDETARPVVTLPDPQPGPEAAAEGRELAAVLQAGLLTLPPGSTHGADHVRRARLRLSDHRRQYASAAGHGAVAY